MPFEKGKSGNPKGKPRGAKNKVSQRAKTILEKIISENSENIIADFKTLKGKDRIKAFTELLPYILPKLQSGSFDIDINKFSPDQIDELYNRLVEESKR